MKLLLDTHLLIWSASDPEKLPVTAATLIADASNEIAFSVVSVWEVVIKLSLGRSGIRGDAQELRSGLLAAGYREIPVTSDHALAVGGLPHLHGDPFDRLLIAQAAVEGLTFVTADALVARYPGAILKV